MLRVRGYRGHREDGGDIPGVPGVMARGAHGDGVAGGAGGDTRDIPGVAGGMDGGRPRENGEYRSGWGHREHQNGHPEKMGILGGGVSWPSWGDGGHSGGHRGDDGGTGGSPRGGIRSGGLHGLGLPRSAALQPPLCAPQALSLCRFLGEQNLELAGRRVLELGAGTGIVGIFAAMMGAEGARGGQGALGGLGLPL